MCVRCGAADRISRERGNAAGPTGNPIRGPRRRPEPASNSFATPDRRVSEPVAAAPRVKRRASTRVDANPSSECAAEQYNTVMDLCVCVGGEGRGEGVMLRVRPRKIILNEFHTPVEKNQRTAVIGAAERK